MASMGDHAAARMQKREAPSGRTGRAGLEGLGIGGSRRRMASEAGSPRVNCQSEHACRRRSHHEKVILFPVARGGSTCSSEQEKKWTIVGERMGFRCQGMRHRRFECN